MQDIRASLERVRERIARAAARAGRRAEDVLLIGVSKAVEPVRIREAVAAGVPALGENRVQEARAKIAELGRAVPWHLVGQLQTNKAKDAVELFDLIHSVEDRKSTRLNSSHSQISYAVFCLKKKKKHRRCCLG